MKAPIRGTQLFMSASILFLVGVLAGAGAAVASDGITIKVVNDTSTNVVVTLIDMNTTPEQSLVSNQTIYGFASISVQVTPDASGYGHIRWTATNVSANGRTCGHKERDQLSADSIVHVSASGSCDAS